MNSNVKNKGLRGFIKYTGISALIFVIVLILGLSVFWKYLDCYQKADPDIPINELIEHIKEADYKTALSLINDSNIFENEEHLSVYIQENFPEGFEQLTVSSVEAADNSYVYQILNGSKTVFTLNVSSTGDDVGFGISSSKITSASVNPLASINITVPQGSVVYVNGVELDESTASSVTVEGVFNTVLANMKPKMVKYITNGHIVYPEIAVTYDFEYLEQDSNTVTKELICEPLNDDPFDIFYSAALSDVLASNVALKAIDACQTYESFISRSSHVNYLLRHIYPESTFYNLMKEYDNTDKERQYGITYSDAQVKNICLFDSTHYSVHLTVNKTVKVSGQPVTEEKAYTAYLIDVDGDLYVTEIIAK